MLADRPFIATFAAASVAAITSLQAQTTWDGDTSTDWADAANWNNGVPAPNGDILLVPGVTFQPTFSGGSLDTIGALFTGANTTSNVALTVTGGSLITGQHIVAPDGGTTGNLVTLNGAGALIGSKYWFIVGRDGGSGTFTLTDGTMNAATRFDHAVLGNTNGSVGVVNIDGGFFNVGGDGSERQPAAQAELWVGQGGMGTVNQTAGVTTSRAYFVVGRDGTGNGTYNLSGGTVNAATVQGFAVIGSFNGAVGDVNVSGTGDFNAPRGLYVAENGSTATLDITGGTVDVTGPINGAGTVGLDIARAGNNTNVANGTVTVETGGTLNVENDLRICFAGAAGSQGALNVDGGVVNVASTLLRWLIVGQYDASDPTVSVTGGGTINLNAGSDIQMGINNNTGNREVTVNGAGSAILGSPPASGSASNLVMGAANNGGSDTLNLENGGLLQINAIFTNSNTNSAVINFDGGILKAVASDGNWINLAGTGTRAVNILSGGASFDTGAFNVTIHNPLLEDSISLNGGVTKTGSGTLTLLGDSTFTGPTLVSEGTLALGGAGGVVDSSGLTIADGAGFNVAAKTSDPVVETLTFQGDAQLTLQAAGDSMDQVVVANTAITTTPANGVVTVNVTNTAGIWTGDPSGWEYPIIDHGGFYGGTVATDFAVGTLSPPLAGGQTAEIQDNGFEIVLVVTGDPLSWTGMTDANWDTASVNWANTGGDTTFSAGQSVLFEDGAGFFNVNLAENVEPGLVQFSNFNDDYTISSSGGFGINGSASVSIDNGGTVTLTTDNAYTGATSVTDGILVISGTGSIADSSSIMIGDFGELVFDLTGSDEYANPIQGTGPVTKDGTGTLTLSGANTFAGDFTLEAGQLNLNSAGALGTTDDAFDAFIINGGVIDNTSGGPVFLAPNKPVTLNANLSFLGTNDLFLTNGAVTLTDTRSVNVPAGSNFGMGAPNDGGAGYDFLKTGDGTLVLNGGNIAGDLDVQGGVVALNQDFLGRAPVGTGILENSGGVGTKWTFWNLATAETSGLNIRDNDGSHDFQLGIVKRGIGSLTLTNALNDTTAQLQVENGSLILQDGSYKRQAGDGSTLVGAQAVIGFDGGANGVLEINGAAVNYNSAANGAFLAYHSTLDIGRSGTGAGAVHLNSGSLDVFRQLAVGRANGAFAAYSQTGGTANIGGFLAVGLGPSQGVVNLSGTAAYNQAGPVTLGAAGGSVGVMSLSGSAVYNHTSTGDLGMWIGENGAGVLTVSDSASLTIVAANDGLQLARGGAGAGVVNLRGGNVTTKAVYKGGGSATLNFNGGSLTANAANANFLTGLTAAYVHSGGGVISNGGNNITVGQSLLAPTGGGVSAAGLSFSGGGCIDTPVVTISGDGVGATAVAVLDGSGNLTGITITNPGIGYTTASVSLSGGGIGNTAAVTGTPTIVANTSGGMTLTGAGVTTMGGVNTYTGNTTVDTGSNLVLGAAGQLVFAPMADTVTNKVTGAGNAQFDGTFYLDLSNADLTDGNTWTLEDVGSPLYSLTFSVNSSLGAFSESANVWTLTDGPNTWTFTEATGVLSLSTGGLAGYDAWLTNYPGMTLTGREEDNDGDGIANVLEFFLGLDPTVSDLGGLPTGTVSGGNLILVFNRSDEAEGDTVQNLQYGSDLSGWTTVAIPAGSGMVGAVTFTVVENGAGPDTITASIPTGGAVSFFARLDVQ
ncbi:auto transporter domain-containing protein [Haloferula helveola]|uniref:Auto transporter domain-containing protein n=1 Tax=Haloferula helveola TaxID=490095 RepID=A0ABM7R6L3_9BACT|nr:auto transporter domain-containing protein [Haloferula helveola]